MIEKFESKMIAYLESAEAFLKSEVPAFIREALDYYLFSEVGDIFILIVLLVIMFFVRGYILSGFKEELARLKDRLEELKDDRYERGRARESIIVYKESIQFINTALLGVGVVWILIFYAHSLDVYRIVYAPKLYLLGLLK